MSRDTSSSEADQVAELIERVRVSDRGVFLERLKRVIAPEDAFAKKGTFVTNGTRNMCLVPANRMSEVVRVTADGEQIWPEVEDEDVSEDLSQLKEIVRQLGQ